MWKHKYYLLLPVRKPLEWSEQAKVIYKVNKAHILYVTYMKYLTYKMNT